MKQRPNKSKAGRKPERQTPPSQNPQGEPPAMLAEWRTKPWLRHRLRAYGSWKKNLRRVATFQRHGWHVFEQGHAIGNVGVAETVALPRHFCPRRRAFKAVAYLRKVNYKQSTP
jgi:hypothetical protein